MQSPGVGRTHAAETTLSIRYMRFVYVCVNILSIHLCIIYIYIYAYVCICMHMYMHMCMYLCMYVCMHVCKLYMYICARVCTCICVYIRRCVCMCTYCAIRGKRRRPKEAAFRPSEFSTKGGQVPRSFGALAVVKAHKFREPKPLD